ncbi:MAG: MBL fold metallo-hydrolase [Ferrovibrio sp.]|uniref:MBL fold metallo-hydrolase n=1 Tax=Ferrovibrio sp. TaxID=1917215 RepID=UPI003919A298
MFSAELRQHWVGQGLFHSGLIDFNNKFFRYVYDCGAYKKKNIRRTYPAYLRVNPSKKLDALFISHLDSDHVNGLGELLKHTRGARHVFLPYIPRKVRQVMALQEYERLNAAGADMADYGDYWTFMQNPLDWFDERGRADEVIFLMRRAEGDGKTGDTPAKTPPDSASKKSRLPEFIIPENGIVPDEILKEVSDGKPENAKAKWLNGRQVLEVRFTEEYRWLFALFYDDNFEIAENIYTAIANILHDRKKEDWESGKMKVEDMLKLDLKEVRQAFQSVLEKNPPSVESGCDRSPMNYGSLCLFSGCRISHAAVKEPPSSTAGNPLYGRKQYWLIHDGMSSAHERMLGLLNPVLSGWLLTGDSVLSDENYRKEFIEWYKNVGSKHNLLAATHTFTVPHHGSKKNFDGEALSELAAAGLSMGQCVAVIPAGNWNPSKWGHPNTEVLQALNEKNISWVHMHEYRGSDYITILRAF